MHDFNDSWLPVSEFEDIPLLKRLGWDKSTMIAAGKAGFLETRWDSKLSCWTTTAGRIRLALESRNDAMRKRILDAEEIEKWIK